MREIYGGPKPGGVEVFDTGSSFVEFNTIQALFRSPICLHARSSVVELLLILKMLVLIFSEYTAAISDGPLWYDGRGLSLKKTQLREDKKRQARSLNTLYRYNCEHKTQEASSNKS